MPITGGGTGGGGGATVLDDLLDVVITAPANGDLLQYNGVNWLNGSYSHNLLSGLTVGDPHSQYLYLAGRAGGQTVSSIAAGDTNLTIKAFASSTSNSLALQSSSGVDLITFRRTDNAGGGDVGILDIVSPTGKNSGAIVLWLAGQTVSQRASGTGKFAEQYYNNTDDAYYTIIANGTSGRVIFGNFSVTGGLSTGGSNVTFTLSPTDKGRFGVNTTNPGATFDIWYNGSSILTVSNAGLLSTTSITLTGSLIANGVYSDGLLAARSGGVSNVALSTDGFSNFLDISLTLKIRDTIGGGGSTVGSLTKTGKLRLGDGTDAVHRLELVAGTATVAPKRSFAGTNLTVQTDGVEEYDGTNFYLSPAAVRQRVALMPAVRGIASFRV